MGNNHASVRELTEWGVEHADPNGKQHAEDKRVGDLRKRIEWVPADVDSEAEGLSYGAPAPGGGYMFRFGTLEGFVSAPAAREVKAEIYKNSIREINTTRRQIRRQVKRNGKFVTETQRIHQVSVKNPDGTVSTREANPVREIVCEPPPWISKLFRENLSPVEQKKVHLRIVTVACQEISKTGVEVLGGGIHQDTGCDHYHVHFSIVSKDRKLTPHSAYAVTGRWPCRMARLQDWGIGQLEGKKAEWFERAMDRNPRGLDVRINEAIDAECRKICDERRLDLSSALESYKAWKPGASKEYLLSKALNFAGLYHAASGIRILETAWHEKAITLAATVAGTTLAASVALDAIRKSAREKKEEENRLHDYIEQMNRMIDDPEMPSPQPPRR